MRHRTLGLVSLLALLASTAGCALLAPDASAPSNAQPQTVPTATQAERGAAAFLGAGFGGLSLHALESNAVPFKLVAAALVMEEQRRDPSAPAGMATFRKVMQGYGFLYPTQLDGVPPGLMPPQSDKPLGMTHGHIAPVAGSRVEVANLGCAACHAGVAYAPDGMPTPDRVVPGMPNTSLDLEAYTQAVFVALRRHADDPALLTMASTLFPDMPLSEQISLRWIVLPMAQRRLAELAGAERALPFPNGLPGATNGVAALKQQLGTPLSGGGADEGGFVSIPDLALRHLRNRLLADGVYATPSGTASRAELAAIASFFTVPSMGVRPEQARRQIPEAEAIFAWLAGYRPQPFPGPVDLDLARSGAATYDRSCASCHGRMSWEGERPTLASYPNWIGHVGTDRMRLTVFDSALAAALRSSAYADVIRPRPGEGYAAPPLAGVWATAPYLHNGSVPSLAALLDPGLRPARFQVGGHALDWETLGIRLTQEGRYPAGYRPFSTPQWVDTSQPGLTNGGHGFGSEMTPPERRALLEFLKLL